MVSGTDYRSVDSTAHRSHQRWNLVTLGATKTVPGHRSHYRKHRRFVYAFSPSLWIATGLFWILDASMNTAQEPYRALVGDKLNDQQRTLGFSVQTLRRCSSKNGSRFQRDLGSHQRDAERIETNLVGEVFYLVRASVDVAVHGAFHRPTLLQCADS